MSVKKISEAILGVGVDDTTIDLFESQYPVPTGVSYNSYVILDEKTAILDTVDNRATEPWLANLTEALAGRKPDYLVVSHMEPDHGANIARLAALYPEMQVVGNAKTFLYMDQFFGTDAVAKERRVVVKDGESMSLGDIDRAMEELGKQFDKLLGEAANADDAETYVERFQSLSEGMEDLKRRKAGILQIRQEQDAVSRRLQVSEAALDAVSAQITEWDEKTVYQLLEKVTVMEGFKIRVTFRNGQEIEQSIDQPKRRKRI